MDIDPVCCLAFIENLNTVKGKMSDKQEQYLHIKKNEEEIKYLKTLHVNDSEVLSMDNKQESMGHSIKSKLQLNVYQNMPSN